MPFKKGQIPWNKTNVTTICEFCGKEFRVPPCRLKQSEREKYGRGKYCSKICKDNNRKGKPSWNSGITGKKYKKHPSDWIRLCAKCHYKYDRQDKRKTKKLSNA